MFFASLFTALGAVLNALFLIISVYIYVSLIRQIAARRSTTALDPPPLRTFGLPEVVVALALLALFLSAVFVWFYADPTRMRVDFQGVVAGLFFNIGLLLFLVVFLRFRRLDLDSLAGFSKLSFTRGLFTGGVLLLAAYPLIALGDALARNFFSGGAGSGRQPLVDLFTGSESIGQRILMIFLAVVIAPIFEEFVFRFFLYGVFKRYLGWFLALVLSALLFATVHTHLPSLVALFVLGGCLTIAYEWSGSILVPMTMHSLFNAVMLTLLAFPEIFPQ
jgi:membrane protease YdiL (CAAX protease family)